MTKSEKDDLPPCLIFIDREGRWFHKGAEMIRRNIIHLFYQNMELDSKGRYVITWDNQRCYVEAEDTAFVVRNVVFQAGTQAHDSRLELSLSDDTSEELSPETLYVGQDNVLYCRVKNLAFPARFSRAAYYQLAKYIEEENGAFYLPLNGEKYQVMMGTPAKL
jgi:hypothetical protein